MTNIIKYDKQIIVPSFVAITEIASYVDSRKEADALVKEYKGVIVDMPRLIQELANPEARNAIRQKWIDVNSAEYQGQTKDGRVYAVGHSLGPLSTTKGIVQRIPKIQEYGFLPNTQSDWKLFIQNPEMVHIDDIKKGFSTNQPYGIFARLDKDSLTINDKDQLDYDEFMKDDRVLMIAGSLEGRENIAKVLFKEEKQKTVGNYHRIREGEFNNSGRPVFFDGGDNGFSGHNLVDYDYVRFGVVASETQGIEKIVTPSLDQIMKVSSKYVAPVNAEALRKELAPLYKN